MWHVAVIITRAGSGKIKNNVFLLFVYPNVFKKHVLRPRSDSANRIFLPKLSSESGIFMALLRHSKQDFFESKPRKFRFFLKMSTTKLWSSHCHEAGGENRWYWMHFLHVCVLILVVDFACIRFYWCSHLLFVTRAGLVITIGDNHLVITWLKPRLQPNRVFFVKKGCCFSKNLLGIHKIKMLFGGLKNNISCKPSFYRTKYFTPFFSFDNVEEIEEMKFK